MVGFFDETTTRVDVVPCTTFRLGSAMTTFRLTTTRDDVLVSSEVFSDGSVTVGSISIGTGISGIGGVSIFGVGVICGVGTDSLIGGSITDDGLITSLLTRFVVEARNQFNKYQIINFRFFLRRRVGEFLKFERERK